MSTSASEHDMGRSAHRIDERPRVNDVTTRRAFIQAAGATLCALPALQGCSSAADAAEFDMATRETWQRRTVTSGSKVAPSWLGSLLFGMFFTPKSENEKYVTHVRSSAGLAVFVADSGDRAHWVQVGRCYERFALQAAALDIRNAMLNQPVEVPAVRPQFATSLGLGALRPDLVVRFGRGAKLPSSLRRPVRAVMVEGAGSG